MRIVNMLSLLILVGTLVGCADRLPLVDAAMLEPVGFWHGLWHGMIFTFAFIVSLFSDDTAVYAVYNNSSWYNFGYFLGLGGFTITITRRVKIRVKRK